jgi:hypothetical protein
VATSKGGGTAGYQASFLVLGVLAAVIFLVSLGLKRNKPKASEAETI